MTKNHQQQQQTFEAISPNLVMSIAFWPHDKALNLTPSFASFLTKLLTLMTLSTTFSRHFWSSPTSAPFYSHLNTVIDAIIPLLPQHMPHLSQPETTHEITKLINAHTLPQISSCLLLSQWHFTHPYHYPQINYISSLTSCSALTAHGSLPWYIIELQTWCHIDFPFYYRYATFWLVKIPGNYSKLFQSHPTLEIDAMPWSSWQYMYDHVFHLSTNLSKHIRSDSNHNKTNVASKLSELKHLSNCNIVVLLHTYMVTWQLKSQYKHKPLIHLLRMKTMYI